MARKKKHEEHENHERWLISYADFITLLFAFFVVMYSVSSVNEGKFRVLSDALIAAFRSSNKSMEPIQVGTDTKSQKQSNVIPMVMDQPRSANQKGGEALTDGNDMESKSDGKEKKLGDKLGGLEFIARMADRIETAMAKLIEQKLIAVRRGALWVEVEINTSILFTSGSANLQNDALPVLKELAMILKDFPNPVRVEGFTDSLPINTVAFPSNWELSAARAASVVHLFSTHGLDPKRLAAIGFAEFRPIADNSTAEGRSKNRRVVIIILESAQAERIFSARDAAPDPNLDVNSPIDEGAIKDIGTQGMAPLPVPDTGIKLH